MNNNLFKRTFNLAIGFGAAQLILVLSTPFLTRLYSPQTFAYFGYILSFVMVLLPLASLQYEYALPLLKLKYLSVLLTKLCLYLVMLSSFLIFLFFLYLKLKNFLPEINFITLLICFAILVLQGSLQVYAMRVIAMGNTFALAQGKSIQNSVMVTFQLCLPFIFFQSELMLLFSLFAGLLVNLIYYKSLLAKEVLPSRIQMSKRRLVYLLKRYYKLPLFSSWAMFIESASTLMPIFLIGPLYGAKALGVYFLVYRVFSAPSSLLNTAVSKVWLKEIADRVKNKMPIRTLFLKFSFYLTLISASYLLIMLIASSYASLIFGPEWEEVGGVLKILAPFIAITLSVSPLSAVFILLNRNGIDSFWQLCYLSLTIIIMYIYREESFTNMLLNLVLAWLILYGIYWLMMLKIVSSREKSLCVA